MMENFENTQPQTEEYVLKIRGAGMKDLNEVRRWAKFFAILGFIAIGLFILMAIGMAVGFSVLGSSSELSTLGAGESLIIVLIMVVFMVLYIFPTLYLWRFSLHAKQALEAKNDSELAESLLYLRKYARFTGIMTIVILVLYILMIPVMMFTALATAL